MKSTSSITHHLEMDEPERAELAGALDDVLAQTADADEEAIVSNFLFTLRAAKS